MCAFCTGKRMATVSGSDCYQKPHILGVFGSAPTIIIDCSSDLVTGKCIAMIPISDLVY